MEHQTLDHWRGYEGREKKKHEEELLPLPTKPQTVIDFEGMREKDKSIVRDSHEWPEIANYYNRYHEVIQFNISVHAHRMRMGLEPIGKVQYVGNTFIYPIHPPVPKDQQWHLGPGNKEPIKEVRDKKVESTGEIIDDEAPF